MGAKQQQSLYTTALLTSVTYTQTVLALYLTVISHLDTVSPVLSILTRDGNRMNSLLHEDSVQSICLASGNVAFANLSNTQPLSATGRRRIPRRRGPAEQVGSQMHDAGLSKAPVASPVN